MNKIFLIGHVGQQPKRTANGTGINYSLAVKERTRIDGEWTERAMWVDVIHWGQNADFVEKYVSKGTKLAIEGRLNINERTDADGQKKRFTNVVAEHIELLSKSENQSNDNQISNPANEADSESKKAKKKESNQMNDDDLPF